MSWERIKAFFSYYLGYTDERDYLLLENKYKGYMWYPTTTKRSVDDLETLEANENDVFIMTYPKCGTHWIIEVANLVLADGYPEQINRDLEQFPLEGIQVEVLLDILTHNTTKTGSACFKDSPSPRVTLSHMPLKVVPPSIWKNNAKIIYVARNLKDMVVSLYNFHKNTKINGKVFIKDFNSLLENVLEGNVPYNGWFEHLQEFWDVRDRENVLFVTYEEMQKDLKGVVQQVSTLLGHKLSDEALQRVIANAEIKKMKSNQDKGGLSTSRQLLKSVGAGDFMHTGVSGGWKKHFTVEQSEEVDRILEKKMKGYEELKQRLGI